MALMESVPNDKTIANQVMIKGEMSVTENMSVKFSSIALVCGRVAKMIVDATYRAALKQFSDV